LEVRPSLTSKGRINVAGGIAESQLREKRKQLLSTPPRGVDEPARLPDGVVEARWPERREPLDAVEGDGLRGRHVFERKRGHRLRQAGKHFRLVPLGVYLHELRHAVLFDERVERDDGHFLDRKSTRLNSSHV